MTSAILRAPSHQVHTEQPHKNTSSDKAPKRQWRDFEWASLIPFAAVHVLAVWGVIRGASAEIWWACAALYVVRMFGVTGGYHRYFSHRTYKTSRFGQFVLAFLAESSSQRGVLWWAAHHRHHHRYSDQPNDVHSPKHDGFWYSHMGWLYHKNDKTHMERVRDLSKYPELRFLNRYWLLPPVLLGTVMFLAGGLDGLLIGFMLSTTLLWHGTFTINSLSHVWGKRPFQTTDTSRNNPFLALITLGEGWHNNHHHHMHSTRQGFLWWQFDITYMILKVLARLGLVWQLREPPEHLMRAQAPSRKATAQASV